jgi:hypothetical protein
LDLLRLAACGGGGAPLGYYIPPDQLANKAKLYTKFSRYYALEKKYFYRRI